MTRQAQVRLLLARALAWGATPLLLVALLWVGWVDPSPADLSSGNVLLVSSYLAAMLGPYVVGVLLTLRVPHQGAGWAFCALSACVAWSGFADEYAILALSGRADLPGAELMATFGDGTWLYWFLVLTLCLHFTATATATAAPRGTWLRRLPAAAIGFTLVAQVAAMLRTTELDSYEGGLVSPLAVPALSPAAVAIGAVSIIALGLCLLVSFYEVASTFRHARGETRQQLLWLVAGAAPLVPVVVACYVVSYAGYDVVAGPILAFGVVTLCLGAGLSVTRYRLYDVERVVADSTAYALSTGAVVAAFGLVVLVITRTVPIGPASPLSTVLATLAAAGVARPAYVWARNAVDRRFNRRRFDAVRVVERGLADGSADVEAVLRESLGDPQATLVFATGGAWVTADGRAAEQRQDGVDIVRQGVVTARLQFDPRRTEPAVVSAVATAAAAEIDNLGLRAELARQVEQVSESRTRLATAHLDERQRIERDLHDGAQQRLLAIALQLQSAQVNGDESLLRDEVDRAVAQLGVTVQELRALASGLQPAALAGGGLRAAVEDLAGRVPLEVRLDVEDVRYPATLETAAWFVVAEGVANAIKHAKSAAVDISARRRGLELVVSVTDDGTGGADPRGGGLQGLADRVAALGGRLSVSAMTTGGTRLEAVFPCAS